MISKIIYPELVDLISSLKIISASNYKLGDKLYTSQYSHSSIDEDDNTYAAHFELKDLLYRIYHCRKAISNDISVSHNSEYNDIQDFTGELSENNTGNGTWEPGWKIEKIEKDGQLVVQKNNLKLWVHQKQFKSSDNSYQIGGKGFIRMVKEYRRLLPGFYMAIGNAPNYDDTESIVVRFYWNITKENSFLLMKILTSSMNERSIPFKFKALNNPYHYPRADAAVLYLDKRYYEKTTEVIEKIYSEVKSHLNSETPLFAKRLGDGLSLAEDPNCNESYGQHRSRLLSEALYSANSKKMDSVDDIILEIEHYFSKQNIDLTMPYINPGNEDNYIIFSD